MMYLKIKFGEYSDSAHGFKELNDVSVNLNLILGAIYTFDGPNGELVDMKYIGSSRVDGLHIFAFDGYQYQSFYPQLSLRDLSFMSVHPIEVNIITESKLGDHCVDSYYKINQDKIVEFLFKLHKINKLDLITQDSYKSVIRDIKLNFLCIE